jgi:hypothetical protein
MISNVTPPVHVLEVVARSPFTFGQATSGWALAHA